MLGGSQRFVADISESGFVLPGLPVTTWRNNDVSAPCVSGLIDAPCIVGAVTAEAGERFIGAELGEQSFDLRCIALTVVGHFDRTDVQGLGINRQMSLAPGATVLGAVFLDLPLALAGELDAGAIDQQMQRACLTTNGNPDRHRGLPAAHSAETGDRPVQAQEPHETTNQPSCLAQRELEQDLQRQNGLNQGIRVDLWAAICTGTIRTQPANVR